MERALEIANLIAKQAPLAVQATLLSARAAVEQSHEVAAGALMRQTRLLMATKDAAEGMMSFIERRDATFNGE